jgi:hypothetical protein
VVSDAVSQQSASVKFKVKDSAASLITGEGPVKGWPPQAVLVVGSRSEQRDPESEGELCDHSSGRNEPAASNEISFRVIGNSLRSVVKSQFCRVPPIVTAEQHRQLTVHSVAAGDFKASEWCVERR